MKQFFICTLHHAIFETLYETIWNTSISSRLLTKKSETRLAMAFFKWLVLFQGNGWTSTGRNNWVCPISLKNCLKFQWCEEILCFSDFVVSWKSKKKRSKTSKRPEKRSAAFRALFGRRSPYFNSFSLKMTGPQVCMLEKVFGRLLKSRSSHSRRQQAGTLDSYIFIQSVVKKSAIFKYQRDN